ncbi:MAG: hypothetical protein Q9216_002036 [Gyalolechia sp. 2 TL-2023]
MQPPSTAKSLLALFLLFTSILAAGPIANPGDINPGDLSALPPPPYQQRVSRTSITLIIDKYTPIRGLDESRFRYIAFDVEYSIVKQLIGAPNDHTIHTPNLLWRVGAPYMTAHNRNLEMTWEILAHSVGGILDFYDNFGTLQLTARVLDDRLGYVGDLEVGQGFGQPANWTQGFSGPDRRPDLQS